MSKDKKNTSSAPKKRAGWLKRLFFGGSKTYADEVLATDKYGQKQVSDVEAILSPGKQIVKNFLEKKYAVVALIIVVLMFVMAYIGPLFMPKYYDSYSETLQQNIYPTLGMMDMPKELQSDIKQISSYGPFTVGLSNAGNVYVWGCTKIGTTGVDVANIPEEVKNANIVMIAAGIDHIIAIDDQGKIYGWGDNKLAQYGLYGKLPDFVLPMSEDLRENGVDINNVKKLICGYQVTAILMNDGRLHIWGNKNMYTNMEYFATMNDVDEVTGVAPNPVLLDDITFTLSYVVGIRRAPEDGSTYDPIVLGPANVKTFVEPKASYDDKEGTKINTWLKERAHDGHNATIKAAYSTCSTVTYQLSDNSILVAGSFHESKRSFVKMPTLAEGEYFVNISAGSRHYSGVTNLGNVYTWGEDLLDQCTMPSKVEPTAKVYATGFQNYSVNEDNELVQTWGNRGYLFGTDKNGANILHRIIIGSRMTMTIGGVAVIISTIIGIIIGCLAGYFGGKVDIVLMRVTEVFAAIPFLPFAMILSSMMTKIPDDNIRIFLLMCILGCLSWTGLARLVRGQVLVARENEYVTAAKSMGIKESTIAFKHILPNVISIIIVTLTLDFATCMLTESSLSYLGFGVQLPAPTWGNMLNGVINMTIINNYWWQWLFTSLFLATTTICINIIGDALRDVMDPKSSAER